MWIMIKSCLALIIIAFILQVAKLPQVRNLSKELLLDIIDAVAEHMAETRLSQDTSLLSLTESVYSWHLTLVTVYTVNWCKMQINDQKMLMFNKTYIYRNFRHFVVYVMDGNLSHMLNTHLLSSLQVMDKTVEEDAWHRKLISN